MSQKVKEIRACLDEVATDRAKFHLSPRSDDRHVMRGREMSYSFVQASDVIRRGQDKEKNVKHLMDPSVLGRHESKGSEGKEQEEREEE